MQSITLTEWQLIPWKYKAITGNGLQTVLKGNGKTTEVQVVDDKTGKRISHVGSYRKGHFKDELKE